MVSTQLMTVYNYICLNVLICQQFGQQFAGELPSTLQSLNPFTISHDKVTKLLINSIVIVFISLFRYPENPEIYYPRKSRLYYQCHKVRMEELLWSRWSTFLSQAQTLTQMWPMTVENCPPRQNKANGQGSMEKKKLRLGESQRFCLIKFSSHWYL